MRKYSEKLSIQDVTTFYILQAHINKLSSNIGVVCESDKEFIKFKKLMIKESEGEDTTIIDNKNSLRIIKNNIEKNYIHISTLEDLYNKYFKKYISIAKFNYIRSL